MKSSSFKVSLTCNHDLRTHIKANLNRFSIKKQSHDGARRAAVAVTVVNVDDDPGVYGITGNELRKDKADVILTQRASTLRNHSGQWSFPGGRIDPGETAEEGALRELEEEVGLRLTSEQILGHLDDFKTRSGFVITPVVLWGGSNVALTPNPSEVGSVHRIPMEELLREDAPLLDSIPESEHPVLMMPVGYSWIATPTGAILYQFREVAVLGGQTRVAHFEQPYFAWS